MMVISPSFSASTQVNYQKPQAALSKIRLALIRYITVFSIMGIFARVPLSTALANISRF